MRCWPRTVIRNKIRSRKTRDRFYPPISVMRHCKFPFVDIVAKGLFAGGGRKRADYREPMNPRPFLGMGGRQDALVAGREAVKKEVVDLLCAFGSAGRACA